jgi:hypothetical protein
MKARRGSIFRMAGQYLTDNYFGKDSLERICDVLNGRKQPEATPELVRLVTLWEESSRNLQKMMHADHALWRDVQDAWKAEWLPTKSGGARIALFPDLPASKMRQVQERTYAPTPEGEALLLFYELTLSPWEYLGGPCARCKRYYVKRRLSQKVYCSRQCGNAATATARSAEKWREEHEEKLRKARQVYRTWSNRLGVDWKKFISEKTKLTVKWLTRNRKQITGKD